MVQREQGPIPESMSLWKSLVENNQEKSVEVISIWKLANFDVDSSIPSLRKNRAQRARNPEVD
jgi:hypothetical protein